ncbi:hypothetical protein [Flaviaesturariibacter terrae]
MSRSLFFLLVAVLLLPRPAAAQGHSTRIKTQAMEMANAFMNNDVPTFIRFMHPNIVAFAGGAASMKTKMDSAYHMMKQFNVGFKRYWIGNPGPIVQYRNQLQAVLPQRTTMLTPMGEITMESALLVISSDNGRNWWFIDTNVYHADKLKSILPDLSPELVIPPRTKPKIVPLQRQ